MVDYEGELAMVIGRDASTYRARAMEVVPDHGDQRREVLETGSGARRLARVIVSTRTRLAGLVGYKR